MKHHREGRGSEIQAGSHTVDVHGKALPDRFGKEDWGFPVINVHQFLGAHLSTTCGDRLLSAEPTSNS